MNLHVYLTSTSYEHLVCGTSCSGPWECTVSQADRNPEASKHPSKHCTKVLWMASKCFKKGLTLLDIREMQTKSTVRCSKQPPEWLRKTGEKRTKDNTKTWQECRTTRTLVCGLRECKLVQPLWKTAWQDLLVIRLAVPAVSLLVVYPAKAHTYVRWTTCTIFEKWTGLRKC